MSDEGLKRRIALIGPGGVGKTALCRRVIENRFVGSYEPTMETVLEHRFSFDKEQVAFNCTVIDTAGQDGDDELSLRVSVGVRGYMLVYSVTSAASFDKVRALHQLILDTTAPSKVPIVIVANKIDDITNRAVSTQEGRALANDLGVPFIEASAFTGQAAEDAFRLLLRTMEQESGVFKTKATPFCTLV